jgi:hypothetical protein
LSEFAYGVPVALIKYCIIPPARLDYGHSLTFLVKSVPPIFLKADPTSVVEKLVILVNLKSVYSKPLKADPTSVGMILKDLLASTVVVIWKDLLTLTVVVLSDLMKLLRVGLIFARRWNEGIQIVCS